MNAIQITRPDDWHVHLRDNEFLAETVAATARSFGRAIVMPNLKPPVTRCEQALEYKTRINQQIPEGVTFTPLMTLYLTENTSPDEIRLAATTDGIVAVKYYPAGATTNSDAGVTDIRNCASVLEAMADVGMPLLVHGEVTNPEVDIFDREKLFINSELEWIVNAFKELKIVLEHITTADAVEFVSAASSNVAATITAHHLLYNRNDMLVGGIKPHFYCLPVLKRNRHQEALLAAATSGNPKFFLGTDSAPHLQGAKESACGCAGCYTAPLAIELYAEAFERMGALDKLEAFASHFGPDFYGLPRNTDQINIIKKDQQIAEYININENKLIPFRANGTTPWTLA